MERAKELTKSHKKVHTHTHILCVHTYEKYAVKLFYCNFFFVIAEIFCACCLFIWKHLGEAKLILFYLFLKKYMCKVVKKKLIKEPKRTNK